MNIQGKWYALDPARYYNIYYPSIDTNNPISYYKMYIHTVNETTFLYDSFIQFEDGKIQALKVDKESQIEVILEEIKMGYLTREKNHYRANVNKVAKKWGLDITMEVSWRS